MCTWAPVGDEVELSGFPPAGRGATFPHLQNRQAGEHHRQCDRNDEQKTAYRRRHFIRSMLGPVDEVPDPQSG